MQAPGIVRFNAWLQARASNGLTIANIDQKLVTPIVYKPEDYLVQVESFSLGALGVTGAVVKKMKRIVITTGMPVNGDIEVTAQIPILTDMMIDADNLAATDITRITFTPYLPRYYELTGQVPLDRIQLSIWYALDDNVLVPWPLLTNTSSGVRESVNIKLAFQRKDMVTIM
jgi:hypothetical protein